MRQPKKRGTVKRMKGPQLAGPSQVPVAIPTEERNVKVSALNKFDCAISGLPKFPNNANAGKPPLVKSRFKNRDSFDDGQQESERGHL